MVAAGVVAGESLPPPGGRLRRPPGRMASGRSVRPPDPRAPTVIRSETLPSGLALATERIRLGTMITPVARRRVRKRW